MQYTKKGIQQICHQYNLLHIHFQLSLPNIAKINQPKNTIISVSQNY